MDGGNVIFKFLGDDKQLNSTMKALGGIGKTALGGLAVRCNCGSNRIWCYLKTVCTS